MTPQSVKEVSNLYPTANLESHDDIGGACLSEAFQKMHGWILIRKKYQAMDWCPAKGPAVQLGDPEQLYLSVGISPNFGNAPPASTVWSCAAAAVFQAGCAFLPGAAYNRDAL